MVRVPFWAPGKPPLTGVSTRWMPLPSSAAASSRASPGLMVAVRTITEPGAMLARRPPSPSAPSTTCFAWPPFRTMTKTASDWAPTSCGELSNRPPAAAKAFALASAGSKPKTSKPAAMRFLASPEPMSPMPTTPTRFILEPHAQWGLVESQRCCGMCGELARRRRVSSHISFQARQSRSAAPGSRRDRATKAGKWLRPVGWPVTL